MTAVAEATLQLDQLDGVLAHFFARRLARHAYAEQTVGTAWARLAGHVDIDALVVDYRQRVGEAARDPDDEAAGTAAALLALRGLADAAYDEDDTDDLAVLIGAIEAALMAGRAEGVAGAVMLAADELRVTGMASLAADFEAAYAAAQKAIAGHAGAITGEAWTWFVQILDGVARDTGRALAVQTARGASRDDMVAAVRGVLLAADGRAVRTLTDLLTSRSMSRGAIDLYAAAGVDAIDLVTAGDGRVCSICDELEADSPFTAADCPAPGIHPSCRCVVVSHAAGLSDAAVAAYLEGGF